MGYKENKKYLKRCLYGLYVFIYMPWFFTLEHFIQPDMPGIHILNTPLDDKIPFCEYFIIPYILWFFYVVGSCIFMLYKASDKEFVQFAYKRNEPCTYDMHDLSKWINTSPFIYS